MRKAVSKMALEELKKITKEFVETEKKYKEFRDKTLGPVWVNHIGRIPVKFVTKEQIMKIKELHELSDEAERKMHKARIEFINSRRQNKK